MFLSAMKLERHPVFEDLSDGSSCFHELDFSVFGKIHEDTLRFAKVHVEQLIDSIHAASRCKTDFQGDCIQEDSMAEHCDDEARALSEGHLRDVCAHTVGIISESSFPSFGGIEVPQGSVAHRLEQHFTNFTHACWVDAFNHLQGQSVHFCFFGFNVSCHICSCVRGTPCWAGDDASHGQARKPSCASLLALLLALVCKNSQLILAFPIVRLVLSLRRCAWQGCCIGMPNEDHLRDTDRLASSSQGQSTKRCCSFLNNASQLKIHVDALCLSKVHVKQLIHGGLLSSHGLENLVGNRIQEDCMSEDGHTRALALRKRRGLGQDLHADGVAVIPEGLGATFNFVELPQGAIAHGFEERFASFAHTCRMNAFHHAQCAGDATSLVGHANSCVGSSARRAGNDDPDWKS
mmetsp:Transcript_18098/g.31725  ORF Transcript_18098/g.31725 Transcript_18098/m.31725 type:complete len:406 (-) Transcript_18098:247-1464(-)